MNRTYPVAVLLLFGLLFFTGVRSAHAGFCFPLYANNCKQHSLPAPRSTLKPAEATSDIFRVPELREDSFLDDTIYGWIEDYARFYDAPAGNRIWQPEVGIFYGPAEEVVTDSNGNNWYKVWGDWLPERHFHIVETSDFRGIEVLANPERPFGWVLRPYKTRPEPNAEPLPGAREVQRYDFVEVHASSRDDAGVIWYDIGQGQWVRYDILALIRVRKAPEEVAEGEWWIDIDLQQQIFATYEGDRMVFAGLISSGLSRWPTRVVVSQVWRSDLTTPMEGGVKGDDYYYIDAVPHTLFYDGEIALHGAYWHDDFGRPKSHGCVNMAPRVAEWVYFWAEGAPNDLWVWAHHTVWGEFLY